MTEEADKFELLCEYLEGTLDGGRRAEVEQLLARDPEARRMLARAREARDALRALPVEAAPQVLRERIAADVAQSHSSRWSPAILFRIAAALLLAIALGLVAWSVLPGGEVRPQAAEVAVLKSAPAPSEPVAMALTEGIATDANTRSRGLPAAPAPTNYYANAEATLVLRGADPALLGREVQSLVVANSLVAEPARALGATVADEAKVQEKEVAQNRFAADEVEVVVVRNANAEQFENVRSGILRLARANNFQVVDMALATEDSRRSQQSMQFQRTMPSATPQAMDRALAQAQRQDQAAVPQLFDMTIVIEQASEPAVAGPAGPAATTAAPAAPPAAATAAEEAAPLAKPARPAPAAGTTMDAAPAERPR